MKKVLIIGGTRFIGRSLVGKLINKNEYDITLFNRGITNSGIFPEINRIKGDRKNIDDLRPILERDWDIVVDISSYWAGALERQFEHQKGRIGKYIFVSTASHYKFEGENQSPRNEDNKLVECSEDQKQSDEAYAFYNENKAECERILARQTNLDYRILRPSLVIGAHDYSDRLYYWLHKIKHQDKILVGNEGKGLSSYTNVNDLVNLIMHLMDHTVIFRVYNASSFDTTIREIIEIAGNILDRKPKLISGDSNFLEEHKISQWTSLPLWLDGDFHRTDNSRAKNEFNYSFSNVQESLEQVLDFYANEEKWRIPHTKPDPITTKREQELILKLEKVDN